MPILLKKLSADLQGEDLTIKDFVIDRDGKEIVGKVLLPGDYEEKQLTPVIISHEYKTNYKFSLPYAEAFADIGYAAFVYNFYDKDEGMTLSSGKKDLDAVVNYALSLPFIKDGSVILMGNCQGGLISALYASEQKNIKTESLILQYAGFCIPDYLRNGKLPGATFDCVNIPEEVSCPLFRMKRNYILDAAEIYPYEEIGNYNGRVLLIHGDKDDIVDISYSEKAKEIFEKNGSYAELKVISGAGHIFRDRSHIDSSISYIKNFIKME